VVTPHTSGGRGACVAALDTGTDRIVSVLAALGHRLRLQLWRMLVPHGPRGLSAGSIATQLAVAPSSLSFHLQQMTQAGILMQRRSSRRIIYAVNSEVVDDLCDFLASHSLGPAIPAVAAVLSAERSDDVVS
jgi:DNA-binding transcriptional ArsR family regulator